MAWTQETTKIAGKDTTVYKNSNDQFNMPIDTKIKPNDTFQFNNCMYKITSIENSRDEFLIVSASAESQPKPEGKKEDDESKEG